MDWSALGAIAEITGVALVIVSLLFVGFQVRQNTQQLRQENLLKTIRGTLDTNWYYHRDGRAFDVVRRGCHDFDALSAQEQAHFHSILVDLSFYVEMVARLSRAGLIDPDALEVNTRFFLATLRTPGGKRWWEIVRRTRPMPAEAIEQIQAMLDDPNRAREKLTDLQPWLAMEATTE